MHDDAIAAAAHGGDVRCGFDWGREGVRRAVATGNVVVVVDVLSFTTAVAIAVDRGAMVRPCADGEDPAAVAAEHDAELAVHRRHVPTLGRYSLSPASMASIEGGTRLVLASPNGATCARHAGAAGPLIIGALVNRAATVALLRELLATTASGATVVACGERWEMPGEDGPLRFAIEDYLGAGAILAELDLPLSAEAHVCARAWEAAGRDAARIIHDSMSGRELIERGYADDVSIAAQVDNIATVPVMKEGWLVGGITSDELRMSSYEL